MANLATFLGSDVGAKVFKEKSVLLNTQTLIETIGKILVGGWRGLPGICNGLGSVD